MERVKYFNISRIPAHLAALIIIIGLAAEAGKAVGAWKQFNDWVITGELRGLMKM